MPETIPTVRRAVRFNELTVELAAKIWGFNCGPAALCAALDKVPREVQPFLGDFPQRGYMGPTAMFDALRLMGVNHRQTYRSEEPGPLPAVAFGIVRVQFGGPWCKPGVPMAVRYHHTHWAVIAGDQAFDINAMPWGGWVPLRWWQDELIPWLIRGGDKKCGGTWWLTHVLEVTPDVR